MSDMDSEGGWMDGWSGAGSLTWHNVGPSRWF